jgi:Asp-tRNA(Asn)/Glu-tRNA(Gln) amidotransferase A subunit family amidase
MFNGIIGFKGTRGCLSTTGVVPCCRSLDCIAIEALSVPDVRKVWSLLHKFDPSDPFAKVAIPSWALSSKAVLQPGQKFRFAIPPKGSQSRGYLCGPFEELFEEAVERLQKIGGELVETVDYTVFEEAGKLLYEGSFVAERVCL